MLYGIALPPYELIKKYEGLGNWAIKKYYQFPYNIFYKKKLRMIIDKLAPGKIYNNILDFGAGAAQIFSKELQKHAHFITNWDTSDFNEYWKFDVIICGSVLEFVPIPVVLKNLQNALKVGGFMIVASPCDNWLTRFYFWIIRDRKLRHSHKFIMEQLKRYFVITEYKPWLGLYFACKATPR